MNEQRLISGDLIHDRFRILQRVGSGAFAAVWSGVDQVDGRPVAIKILHAELAEHPYVVQRFQREMEVMAKLDHPNIARAIAAGSDARCRYLAMQFVEGTTLLDQMIDVAVHGASYSIPDILDVGARLAAALDHAHALGVIHRDLKPNNVMVQRIEGTLVPTILDFGIAKVAAELSDQTTLGRRLGTLMYMTPEQLRGRHVEASADVFALGVILFEMLTLRRLFARDAGDQPLSLADPNPPAEPNNHAHVMTRIAAEPRPRASLFRDGIGASVDEVLLQATDPAPKNRFGSAGALMRALTAAIEGRATAPPPRAETALASDTLDPVELTKVVPQPLTSIDHATTAQVQKEVPYRRKWPAVLVAIAVIAAGAIYLDEEPAPIVVEAIPPPAPLVRPTVQAREIDEKQEEEVEKIVEPQPVRLPPPPAKAKADFPPRPRRDPAIVAMLNELESEDPALIARVARRLEQEAQRLESREDQLSIRRCASMSALRAEKRELVRCLERFEALLLVFYKEGEEGRKAGTR